MSFGTKRHDDRLTLRGISTARRHIYFYLLLFLGTAVVHNVWQATQPLPVRSATEDLHAIVTTARQMSP